MAERMKPSGIDWIGDIPASWKRSKVKFCFSLVNGSTPESSDYDCWDGDIKWITPADMSDTGTISHGERLITKYGYNSCGTTLLPIGSIVISSRAPIGKINITTAELCTNQGCKSLIRTGDNRYFYYLFLAGQHELSLLGRGTTFLELSTYDLNGFGLVIPAEDEQKAIADFLDKECAQIDSIAADLEKQIALLQQYKKSLITETVTKGLDKSVPMKDSGNPIIGSINYWYATKKLKYIVATPITDGPHETPVLVDDGIPFLSAESVKNGILDFEYKRGYISESDHKFFCKKIKPQKNDVFIVKSGATTGNVGIVTVDQEFSIWSPLALIRCDDKTVLQKFIYYCVSSNYFKHEIEQAWSYGTQQNIGMGVVENLTVVIPPVDEQKKIVHYLDDVLASMDKMIIDKTKQLEIIQQHKKSLIYEYVTGKKRVKEVR
jgi:type I restriction enzyme S subunit